MAEMLSYQSDLTSMTQGRASFSMEFDQSEDYESYNSHPLHEKFVNERWVTEVERFLEIDYRVKEQ